MTGQNNQVNMLVVDIVIADPLGTIIYFQDEKLGNVAVAVEQSAEVTIVTEPTSRHGSESTIWEKAGIQTLKELEVDGKVPVAITGEIINQGADLQGVECEKLSLFLK